MNLLRRFRRRLPAAERLLAMRERAAGDDARHVRFHRLVNRYQRWLLRARLSQRWRAFLPSGMLRRWRKRTHGW